MNSIEKVFGKLKEQDVVDLKKSLDTFEQKKIKGKFRPIECVGGPHDGAEYYIVFKDGEPAYKEISLSLNKYFEFGKEYDCAFYEWNEKKIKYYFVRFGKNTIYKKEEEE